QGLFREDLFYRLNVVPLRIPALRERLDDIPDLVRHFLASAASEGLPLKRIEPEAVARLQEHRWPGNVRELENLIRRLVAIYPEEVITRTAVESELAEWSPAGEAAAGSDRAGLGDFLDRYLAEYFARYGNALPPPGLYNRILAEVEQPLIRAALAATAGNQIRAAEILGINRNTLRKKIRDRGIAVLKGTTIGGAA